MDERSRGESSSTKKIIVQVGGMCRPTKMGPEASLGREAFF